MSIINKHELAQRRPSVGTATAALDLLWRPQRPAPASRTLYLSLAGYGKGESDSLNVRNGLATQAHTSASISLRLPWKPGLISGATKQVQCLAGPPRQGERCASGFVAGTLGCRCRRRRPAWKLTHVCVALRSRDQDAGPDVPGCDARTALISTVGRRNTQRNERKEATLMSLCTTAAQTLRVSSTNACTRTRVKRRQYTETG